MNRINRLWWLAAVGLWCSLASVRTARGAEQVVVTGKASWHIGDGGRTASGLPWKAEELMAAHRSLPLGCRVRVTNLRNGLCTIVRITDRGPYARGRIIDLSRAAAREIGLLDRGVGEVRIETLPPPLIDLRRIF